MVNYLMNNEKHIYNEIWLSSVSWYNILDINKI
jgi:hypothetical protein